MNDNRTPKEKAEEVSSIVGWVLLKGLLYALILMVGIGMIVSIASV